MSTLTKNDEVGWRTHLASIVLARPLPSHVFAAKFLREVLRVELLIARYDQLIRLVVPWHVVRPRVWKDILVSLKLQVSLENLLVLAKLQCSEFHNRCMHWHTRTCKCPLIIAYQQDEHYIACLCALAIFINYLSRKWSFPTVNYYVKGCFKEVNKPKR